MGFYSVGVGALNAAQLGLSTAGHNIANVNTEGFHRQSIVQATSIPLQTGAGFIGQGVEVQTVRRIYSQFLDNQVVQAQTRSSELNTYLSQISQIDNIVADPNSGLSPALQDFFKAMNDVATNPSSVPSRQALLSSANSMITRFESLSQRFEEIRTGVNGQLRESVGLINSYAQQIAEVNDQIVRQSSGTGHAPNDFYDLRETLIARLNQQVRATTVQNTDGTFNVFIGKGQPLVVGGQVFQLTATPSPEDQSRVEVSYAAGSTDIILGTDSLDGGVLGGLLSSRNEVLDQSENALGRVAVTLAQAFNTQHALGQDLLGDLGGDFFKPPAPTVLASVGNNNSSGNLSVVYAADIENLTTDDYRIQVTGTGPNAYQMTNLATGVSSVLADDAALLNAIPGLTITPPGSLAAGDVFTIRPTRFGARDIALSSTISTTTIAAAAPVTVKAETTNTGAAKIVASGVTDVSALPLGAGNQITLTYDQATNQFVVSGTTPAIASYTPGTPIELDNGITLTLTGVPADNDVFTISDNLSGVSDNRNALLLAKLQTANTMVGGTTSFQGAYSQMVGYVGNKTSEVKVTSASQESLLKEAKNSQQQLSGVNLDEEAANLLRFQQAYQAAAKMMQIANNTFDILIDLAGR